MNNKNQREEEFIEIRNLIKENYKDADCGLFNTRNFVNDNMSTIFTGKYFTLDICYYWSYFEVFGTTEQEFDELKKIYKNLQKKKGK